MMHVLAILLISQSLIVFWQFREIDRIRDREKELEDDISDVSLELRAADRGLARYRNSYEWELFYQALCIVESEMCSVRVGDDGKAVGILQIHKIMVDDVNRIQSEIKYNYADRYDALKSKQMFNTIQEHYNKEKNFQKACAIWNSGGGVGYYKKVMVVFNKLNSL